MTMRALRLFALCCGMLAAHAGAAQKPFSLTLDFAFFYNGIKAADVREVFAADADGRYEITSSAAATGLAKILYGDVLRKSEGRIDRFDGLRALRYEEKRGARPQTAMETDEAAGVLHLRKGEERRSEPLPEEPLADYLTALYRSYILGAPASGKAAATNGWRLKVYEYAAGGLETVRTKAGEIQAVPVSRESPRGRRVFWLAPSLDYLPVKVYVDDKGHIFETVLVQVRGIGD